MCKPLLLLLFAVSTVLKVGCQIPGTSMPGYDYRIFQYTPCWALALAIHANDSSKVRQLVGEQHMTVNCFDPHYGTSLLDIAIINNKAEAFEALLQAGVDVNARSPKNSTTALFDLCSNSAITENTLFYLTQLIQHGADVNASVPDSIENVFAPRTCLEQLVLNTRSVEAIRLLLDHGAKLDRYPLDGPDALISHATINSDLRPLRYLLMERKLAIPAYIDIRDKGGPQQETLTLRKVLEERNVTRYPEQQKVKEEILAFLAAHGQ